VSSEFEGKRELIDHDVTDKRGAEYERGIDPRPVR
jgi:hypothetical protein